MHVDLPGQKLITFGELAGAIPSRRNNRPSHVSTIHRWRHPGLRGVRLSAIRVGGSWCTTWEAFAEFCDALTALEVGDPEPAATSADRKASRVAVDAQLEEAGW